MIDKVRPLKRFGQNYLIDKNIILKIIEEFVPEPEDEVIEIGPGMGSLTNHLISKVRKLTAIEIDKRVIGNLKKEIPGLNIINDDFLLRDIKKFTRDNNKVRVIGNIPYNITSSILFKLIEEREYISDAMFMVQYEVAKRMTAKQGTKDYSILSVLLNYFSNTRFCFKISPNVFYPKPKVFSAIVHITFKEIEKIVDDKLFIQVVKASFGNRRKTLKNSLTNSIFGSIDFENLSHLAVKRAEELSTQEFILLANLIKEQLNGRGNQKLKGSD